MKEEVKKCPICNSDLPPKKKSCGVKRIYCSQACKQEQRRILHKEGMVHYSKQRRVLINLLLNDFGMSVDELSELLGINCKRYVNKKKKWDVKKQTYSKIW